MSIRVMTLVWDNFKRSGSELVVMLALADWCNDEGSSLHPSISAVAAKARISESQARRIVHAFIDEGFLTVVANHNGGDKGQSRHYRMNIKKLSTPSADATPSTSASPCMDATPSTDAHDPLALMRVTPSTHDTLTTKNHHKNHQESVREVSKPNPKRSKKPLIPIPDGFEISDGVRTWAQKNNHTQLEAHFDAFVLKAQAKAYQYVDWDAALKVAIAADWAGLKKQPAKSAGQAQQDQSTRQTETPPPRANTAFAGADLYAFNQLKKINPELSQAHVRELARMREKEVCVVLAQMKKDMEMVA